MSMPHERAAMDALRTKLNDEGLRGALMLSSTPLTMQNLEARVHYAREVAAAGKSRGRPMQAVYDAIRKGMSVKDFRDSKAPTLMSPLPKVTA